MLWCFTLKRFTIHFLFPLIPEPLDVQETYADSHRNDRRCTFWLSSRLLFILFQFIIIIGICVIIIISHLSMWCVYYSIGLCLCLLFSLLAVVLVIAFISSCHFLYSTICYGWYEMHSLATYTHTRWFSVHFQVRGYVRIFLPIDF